MTGAVGVGELHERVPTARALGHGHGTVAILDVCFMDEEFERVAIRTDHGVPLVPHHPLVGAVPCGSQASVVLTPWLSITAADGPGSRPIRSRSSCTRWWLSLLIAVES